MKSRILYPIIPLLLLCCARQGTISGGAKDKTPPKLLRAVPPNRSTNFKAKRFRIYFNEYIRLKNTRQNLIISPPLEHEPKLLPVGTAKKYLEVRITDTLKPATTYNFDFGGSVVDNNEGNKYGDLQYVFSTGNTLDSLQLRGVIRDALQHSLPSKVRLLALLYRVDSAYSDSAVYQRKPDYASFADTTGAFQLSFIKPGDYKLYAMIDKAKDFIFQPKSDEIAFVSQTIHLNQPDSTRYTLRLFKEVPPFRVLPPEQPQKGLIDFKFEGESRTKKVLLTPERPAAKTLTVADEDLDVIHYWHPFATGDSLRFYVYHRGKRVDTLSVKILPHHDRKKTKPQASDKGKEEKPYKLLLKPQAPPRPDVDYTLRTPSPLIAMDTTRIRVLRDTVPIPFTAKIDSSREKVRIAFDKKPGTSYTLKVLPEAFTDFFGQRNDTLNASFSIPKQSDFAVVKLKLSQAVGKPFFLDLLDEKNTLKQSRYIEDSTATAFDFKYVDPGKYYFRIRVDANRNKRWDTGSAYRRVQPEPVYFYPGTFELRAFWDVTENWKIGA